MGHLPAPRRRAVAWTTLGSSHAVKMMGEEGGYAWTENEGGCEKEGGVHDAVFYPIVRC